MVAFVDAVSLGMVWGGVAQGDMVSAAEVWKEAKLNSPPLSTRTALSAPKSAI